MLIFSLLPTTPEKMCISVPIFSNANLQGMLLAASGASHPSENLVP